MFPASALLTQSHILVACDGWATLTELFSQWVMWFTVFMFITKPKVESAPTSVVIVDHSRNTGDLSENEWGTLCFCRRAFDCSSFRQVSSLSSFCVIKLSSIERRVYREHCGSLTQCTCHHHEPCAHIGNKSTTKESACGGGLSQIG